MIFKRAHLRTITNRAWAALPAAVTKRERLFPFNPSHRLNDFPNWQKNKILKVLGKWNYHQARLHVANFLQRIASAQAPLTGISHSIKNGFDASGCGRVI